MKKVLLGISLLTSMSSFASFNCEMYCMIAHEEPIISGLDITYYYNVTSSIKLVYPEGETRNQAYQNALSECRDMGGNFIVHSYTTGGLSVAMVQLPGRYLLEYSDPTPRKAARKTS